MSTTVRGRALTRLASSLALAAALAGGVMACGGKNKKPEVENGGEQPKGPSVEELLDQARAARVAGDVDGADAKYLEAIQRSQEIAIFEEHVTFLIENRRVESAVDNAKVYVDANPDDARGLHLYCQALLAAGDFATALQVAGELIARDDGDAAAHEKRGRGLVLAGQFQEGIEELQRAKSLDENNVGFLVELGSALLSANRAGEAMHELRRAVELDPNNGRAYMLLGLALKDLTELEEAEVQMVQATKKMRDARPWFELGIIQNRRGDDLGAEASLARAVEIEPENSLYQYAYGEMLRLNKKWDEAINAYTQASELSPPHPKAAAKLGYTLYEADRLNDAVVYLTKAIREEPDNPYNYFNLAMVYKEQEEYKLAISMFEEYLRLADPQDGDRGKANSCLKAAKKKKKKC